MSLSHDMNGLTFDLGWLDRTLDVLDCSRLIIDHQIKNHDIGLRGALPA